MSARIMGLLVLGFGLIAIAVCSALGGSVDPGTGLWIVLTRIAQCGWAPALYLLAGAGYARLLRPLFKYAGDTTCLQGGLGLALALTSSLLLGQAGLLHGETGLIAAWVWTGTGLVLLGQQILVRRRAHAAKTTPAASAEAGALFRRMLVAMLASMPLGVLLTAAASPPGALWDSEFGGFDAQAYHLALPQEWLTLGRIRPLDHNVYSYLPGGMEAAYLHIAALTDAPVHADETGRFGLLAGTGWRAISCQMLHAFVTLGAAWCVARMVRRLLVMAKVTQSTSSAAAWLSAALVLATPWTIVCGSLAYNDMALVALFASACLAAVDLGPSPGARGVLSGLLVGAACAAKPTALLFAGIPVGLLLLGTLSPRVWMRAVLPGAFVGMVVLAPWLVRNYEASRNPVFPAATAWFGTGHWTPEQVERFHAAHRFEGTTEARLRLAVFTDEHDPAGSRHRGLFHPQWGLLFPLVAASLVVGAVWARARLFVILLALGLLAQLSLWLTTTHIQSRFLAPAIVPSVGLATLAFAGVRDALLKRATRPGEPAPMRDAAFAGLWLPLLGQVVFAVVVFARQRHAHPNEFLAADPAEVYAAVNDKIPGGSRLLLIGETAPFYRPQGTLYNTTWDRWLFLDDQARLGATHALVDLGEIDRLARSRFLDPTLSVDRVAAWMRSHGTPVEQWSDQGRFLIRLAPVP